MQDPRLDLGDELVDANAARAVEALDSRRVIVCSGREPQQALTAAATLVLAARTHAHVEVDADVELPGNPWGASSLGDLLATLGPLRPEAVTRACVDVTVGTDPGRVVQLAVGSDTWAVEVAVDGAPGASIGRTTARGRLAVPPLGGLLGASWAAAHLFCEALAGFGLPVSPRRERLTWNLLRPGHASADLPDLPVPCWPAVLFAACGSVGSSAAAALACADLTGLDATCLDSDVFDPERNTFRYPAAVTPGSAGKSAWVAQLLADAGATTYGAQETVGEWTVAQSAPGFDGLVLSSVDTVDGRWEVADVLARTTVSAAVDGLAFHVQREQLGDGLHCPFCDFVDLESPMAQTTQDAQLSGLSEQRIIELRQSRSGLTQSDLDVMVAVGRLRIEQANGLLGRRVDDLRPRLYAQLALSTPDASTARPAALTAPFVSWSAGVLLAAEVVKKATGHEFLDRRVEVDMHGYPPDHVIRLAADASGRCACARQIRRTWMRRLYS